MKLRNEFVVRSVADKTVAIAVNGGDDDSFNGMLTLNDSGAFIFERLKEETDMETLVADFLKEYDATREEAEGTITRFVEKLKTAGLIE